MSEAGDRALELLRKLEWSGWTKGPPTAMHLDNGKSFRACPVCHGIQPDQSAENHFISSAIGHRRGCSMQSVLRASPIGEQR